MPHAAYEPCALGRGQRPQTPSQRTPLTQMPSSSVMITAAFSLMTSAVEYVFAEMFPGPMDKLATLSPLMPYMFKCKSMTPPFSCGFIAQVPSYYSAVPTGKRGRVRKCTALIVPKNCIKCLCLICCKIWSEHNVVIRTYHVPKSGTWIIINNCCTARTDLGNSRQCLASRRAAPHQHLLGQTWHRFPSAPICLEYRTTQQIGR